MIFNSFVTIILFEKTKPNKQKIKKLLGKKLLFSGSNGPPYTSALKRHNKIYYRTHCVTPWIYLEMNLRFVTVSGWNFKV